ncbi:MAG: hypothetical protein JRM80_09595, partial [Nitrososphaerota archaeon]|nr:hypothetical protein [Nitrososphaerota archaeon]
MVRASYDQKPYRRNLMELYGAEVVVDLLGVPDPVARTRRAAELGAARQRRRERRAADPEPAGERQGAGGARAVLLHVADAVDRSARRWVDELA